jgi:hypothetical protein
MQRTLAAREAPVSRRHAAVPLQDKAAHVLDRARTHESSEV